MSFTVDISNTSVVVIVIGDTARGGLDAAIEDKRFAVVLNDLEVLAVVRKVGYGLAGELYGCES